MYINIILFLPHAIPMRIRKDNVFENTLKVVAWCINVSKYNQRN